MSIQPGLSYTQNFSDISGWVNGFTGGGVGSSNFSPGATGSAGAIPGGTNLTQSTATFVTGSSGGPQKGTGNIQFLVTGATDNTGALGVDLFLDFTGLNAGTVSFDWAQVNNSTGDRRSSFRLYYSVNGTTWVEIPGALVSVTNNGTPVASGTISGLALPAVFNGSSSARLRFYVHNGTGGTTGSRPKVQIDNIIVTAVSAASAPSVTTVAASATNTTTATVNGNVTSDGGASVTDRGVCYKTSAGVTISDNKTAATPATGTGSFSVDLSSLSVNQQYFFKAYAINSAGTALGSELTFNTLANTPSAPTVNNPTPSSLDVNVNVNGNPSATEFAIQVTNNGQYVQSGGTLGASPVWQTDSAWGTKTVTGLASSQEYGFQVKARNGENVETAFSSVSTGTTSAGAPTPTAPTVSTPTATSVASTTATLGGTIDSTNNAPVTERGVYWHTSSGFTPPGTGTKVNQTGTFGNGAFTVNASGLPSGSLLYFVAYASNSAGVGYSSESSFTTIPAAPTTAAATTVTNDSFTANWSSSTGATNYLLDAATAANFSSLVSGYNSRLVGNVTSFSVTGLSPNVTYYYRVRAENAGGISGNSTTTSVTTVTMLASVTTTPVSAITTLSASSGGNVIDDGGAAVTARGVCWNTTGSPTTGDSTTSNGSGSGLFTSSLTGLVPGQSYFVRAYAVNSVGTSYGNEQTFSAACFSSGPTGVYANPTNTTDFTANWSAVSGATGYRLDVSTNLGSASSAVITRFDFNAVASTPSLIPSVVNAAVTSSIVQLSAGTIETNLSSDGNFPNPPYIEETGGWNVNNQAGAKYFTFTIVPVNGNSITVTGISFRALATGAGPSAFSYDVGGGLSTGTSNAPSSSPVVFNNVITGVVGRTTALEIRIQGWTNGTRVTSGAGAFRLDDVQISGFVQSPANYVPGFSNLAVAGTSQSVTGLNQAVNYKFVVRAEGASGCVIRNSHYSGNHFRPSRCHGACGPCLDFHCDGGK
jgi:hypothetical protein